LVNLLDLASRRISTRKFSSEEIRIEDVIYAIEVARQAPSGANRQPWRFIIVYDNELKMEIRKYCEEVEKIFHEKAPTWMKKWLSEKGITWRKEFLTTAPLLILVFGKRNEPYWVQSVWLAIGYMLLALEEKGLASLTYTPPRVDWANRLLNVPTEYILQTIIPIGISKEENKKKIRFELKDILYCNKWNNPCKNLQILEGNEI